jgi:hypothetical protein
MWLVIQLHCKHIYEYKYGVVIYHKPRNYYECIPVETLLREAGFICKAVGSCVDKHGHND